MNKRYIVELTAEERSALEQIISRLKGSSQKVRRAHILLKADANGPGWTDAKISEAFDCRTKTVENVRQRFVEQGFEIALNGKKREKPPTEKLLDGRQEAKIIATRLGQPPAGYGRWTLRLLARKVVELEIVEAVSYQTIRRTLKGWDEHQASHPVLGHSSRSRCRVCGAYGGRFGRLFPSLRRERPGAVHGRATSTVGRRGENAHQGDQEAPPTSRSRIQTGGRGEHLHVCRTTGWLAGDTSQSATEKPRWTGPSRW